MRWNSLFFTVFFVLGLSGALWSGAVLSQPTVAQPFVLAYDESGSPEGSYSEKLNKLVFADAFRRMNVPLKMVHYPTARLTLMLKHGDIDGEMARGLVYAKFNPELIRVTEHVQVGQFGLYTADPNLSIASQDELRTNASLRVEYRIGVLACEADMKAIVPESRLTAIPTTQQGLAKLLLRRTDLYCDIDTAVTNVLSIESLKGAEALRVALPIGGAVPLYPYVAAKHAELALRLAETLKQMRREGVLARYAAEVTQSFAH
jgi:polar amino acid transport system substrate-binding protein